VFVGRELAIINGADVRQYIEERKKAGIAPANLENVHPHDLRRTFGSWLVQSDVPIQTVSALLRHSDIRVTVKVYAHLAPENLRGAAAVLDVVSR